MPRTSAEAARDRYRDRAVGVGVWLAAGLLGWVYLGRGWIPHDVGTLGHAAERVLQGELPHRDFVDVYTGGQAMLHALAFRLLGVEVMTLRFVFFAAYMLWVPVVWLIARSLAGPALAACATLLAASMTLPIYPEGMPSWYNLFLATAGVGCLVRYVRRPHVAWLVMAGVAGGASVLFKVVGLYYVAGALLFLLYLETMDTQGAEPDGDRWYRVAAGSACAALAFAALYLVTEASGAAGILHFALPPLTAVAVVGLRLMEPTGRTSRTRFRSLSRTALPLLFGVAVPVAVFLIPYAFSGSLPALWQGVFVLPRSRLEFAAQAALPLLGFLPAAALVTWITSTGRASALVGGAAVIGLVATTQVDIVYRIVWWTLISLGPIASVACARRLTRSAASAEGQRSAAMALLAVFGYANLVQLPFSAPIYFLYAAPLLVLLALTVGGEPSTARAPRLLLVTASLLAFSVFRLDAGFIHHLGYRYRPSEETEVLEIERARGIRVSAPEKREIEQLVAVLDGVDAGPAVLALPDAPEVYFLTGLANPTTTLFDFFEDPELRRGRVLDVVDEGRVSVVVLNRRSLFSPPVDQALLDSLTTRLSWSAEVGRFRILWRGPARSGAR
jgi:hypothetical protein